MKDAFGHGSNGRGGPYLRSNGRSVLPSRPFRHSDSDGPQKEATDQDAAEALKNSKSSEISVHTAFGRRTVIPTGKQPKHPVEIYKGNPL